MKIKQASLLILFVLQGCGVVLAREWKDNTGKFKIEAELREVRGKEIVLVRSDGKQIVVPIARLSDDDQRYLRSIAPATTNPATNRATSSDDPHTSANRGHAKAKDSGRPVPLAAALKTPAPWQLTEPTIQTLVDTIRSECRINVFLSFQELFCNRIAMDQPLPYRSSGKPLHAELDTAFESTGLGWYVHDDVLVITTIKPCDHASVLIKPVLYRVLKGGNPQQLSQEIQRQVAPESWEARMGNKIIAGLLPSSLIVIQQPLVHAELEKKFSGSIQAIHAPSRMGDQFKVLDQRGSISCPLMTLEQVVQELSQQFQVPIVLDVAELRSGTRVTPSNPVSIQLENVRLATALQLMISGHELAFVAKQDRITITSLDASESEMIPVDYNARSLMFSRGNASRRVDVQPALDLLTSISPSSWEEVGGPASITMASPGNLRITHSTQAHLTIRQLLADLRLALR